MRRKSWIKSEGSSEWVNLHIWQRKAPICIRKYILEELVHGALIWRKFSKPSKYTNSLYIQKIFQYHINSRREEYYHKRIPFNVLFCFPPSANKLFINLFKAKSKVWQFTSLWYFLSRLMLMSLSKMWTNTPPSITLILCYVFFFSVVSLNISDNNSYYILTKENTCMLSQLIFMQSYREILENPVIGKEIEI